LFRYQQLRQPPNSRPEIFIGFAPFYSGDTTALAEAFPELGSGLCRDLQPLPYSGSEIAKLVNITGGRGFYGADAEKSMFLQLAPSAKIIHLATHAQANWQLGDFSFLAFSDAQKDPNQSLLFARELYNLSLSADMVVLSACETGLGRYGMGEGIVGFSRALTCAGARSLVASQWSVNNRHTQTLMLLFYKELREGRPKNMALWNAKKSFLKDFKDDAEPFFWAAFTLFGDTTPIHF
jgi:CHAT domain-containing protein